MPERASGVGAVHTYSIGETYFYIYWSILLTEILRSILKISRQCWESAVMRWVQMLRGGKNAARNDYSMLSAYYFKKAQNVRSFSSPTTHISANFMFFFDFVFQSSVWPTWQAGYVTAALDRKICPPLHWTSTYGDTREPIFLNLKFVFDQY